MKLFKQHLVYIFGLMRQGIDGPSYLRKILIIIGSSAALYNVALWLTIAERPFYPNRLTDPLIFFFVGMAGSWWVAWGLMIQLTKALYQISTEEAAGFVLRLFYGVPARPPKGPTLVIRKGQILPSCPEVLRKVGGPAFASIGHESAAITSLRGQIYRVLKPGFHKLHAFEKVWDVVDLRPQRRGVKVETYTRDGIPIYCEAEIRFNLDNGQEPRYHALPFNDISAQRVLELTTGKVVLSSDNGYKFTSWTGRMYKALLDGKIQGWIEQYRLDDLISPASTGEPMIARLQQEVEDQLRQIGESIGVWVERVEIKSLRPDEEHISEQWLELWRSEWDLVENERKAKAKALGTEEVRLARVRARTHLLREMIPYVEDADTEDTAIRTLRTSKFLEAVQAMVNINDPIVRSTVFHQAKELYNLIQGLEEDIKSIEDTPDVAAEEQQP
jgi:regulator of protease activity HflC (stomatin/prohibitin superfamily)